MTTQPPRIPFTPQAYQRLQQEFDELTEKRKDVLVRLQAAREMGDLSENGAYKYAKFELGDINRKLRQLTIQLRFGYVVEKKANGNQVEFGSLVTLKNDQRSLTFMLVSEYESDPAQQKLSTKSPIGSAVVNKKVGDVVTITTPQGEIQYSIEKIE